MAAHDLVRTMNDRMPDSAKLYSHRDNDQSHETRDRVVHVATAAASADEKNQADGSLLSGFRAFDPAHRSGPVPTGQTLAGTQEIGSIKAD
jgi:hypothetical protein